MIPIPFPFKSLVTATGAVVIIGGLALVWSTGSSYLRTGASMAGDGIRSMVPTTFEIERLSTLVGDLDATLAKQRSRLITQQVDLDYLRKEVQQAQDQAQRLEGEVRAAHSLLAVERASYTLGGRDFSRDRVVAEAHAKAESLVRARSIAEAKGETLAALEQALQRAEEQISNAGHQRQAYAMRLAELKANAQHVAMRQELVTTLGTVPGDIDRGAFQRVEDTFARIEREIEVQGRLLDREHAHPNREAITFDDGAAQDILVVLGKALGEDSAVPAQRPSAGSEQPSMEALEGSQLTFFQR